MEDENHSNNVAQESTNIHRSATPTNPPSGSKSAESSPKVSRSKSLRIPRPAKYSLKSQSQTTITESRHNGFSGDDDLVPDMKSIGRLEHSSSPRGRSQTITSSSSNHSSRSNSPSVSSGGTVTDKRPGGRISYGGGKSGSGLRGEGVAGGYSLSQAEDSVDVSV